MEAPAIRNQDAKKAEYGIFRRARAFVRGLFKREPLLEVALEGFRGGYSLPSRLEARYRLRIESSMGHSGSNERYARMLRSGCPEGAQELFAGLWHAEFSRKMDMLSQLSSQGRRHADMMAKGGKAATELTRLRGIAADLVSCGAITSREALLSFAPMLRHHDSFDSAFITHSKVFHAQLRRVLDSPKTAPDFRSRLEESVAGAKCQMCAEELRTPQGQK